MRYSKSSLLSVALTLGFSAVAFTASAEAQNTAADFPWRAKAKTQVKQVKTQARSTFQKADGLVEKVETSFSTPSRDLRTVETIQTPTPNYESMPAVIYDEGKKYIRQGDTYIESPNVANATVATQSVAGNLTQQLPSAKKKTSLFQKTKGLTSRLNPFSTRAKSSAYSSKDWKVPSFSKTLPVFSQADKDPITFATIAPLPAKTSTPSSIDASKSLYAATETKPTKPINTLPTLTLPSRDSQFSSALPTETKLTSAFGGSEPSKSASYGFQPNKFEPIKSASTKLPAIESEATKLVTKVESSFASTNNVISRSGPQISVFESRNVSQPINQTQSAPARRTASLSADHQFWSPQR
ncbi:hypothetical protein OAG71_01425 [bacterium]|nr:hypothetical protein [bacterium]